MLKSASLNFLCVNQIAGTALEIADHCVFFQLVNVSCAYAHASFQVLLLIYAMPRVITVPLMDKASCRVKWHNVLICVSLYHKMLMTFVDDFADLFKLHVIIVLDTNDRFLRKITIGQSPTEKGHERQVIQKNSLFSLCLFLHFYVFSLWKIFLCFNDLSSEWYASSGTPSI